VVNNQEFIQSKKTIFNRVVGDSYLELRFAKFLDDASDVEAFIKLMLSVHFSIPYIRKSGEISYYYPDFAVRTNSKSVYIVETKGLEDIDVAPKWKALKQWCSDATELDPMGRTFQAVYVSQKDFDEVEKEVKTMEKLVGILGTKEPLGV
jgi:type III restriction enzyme